MTAVWSVRCNFIVPLTTDDQHSAHACRDKDHPVIWMELSDKVPRNLQLRQNSQMRQGEQHYPIPYPTISNLTH